MLAAYNRKQLGKTVLLLCWAPVGFLAAWFFFSKLVPMAVSRFGWQSPEWFSIAVGVVFLVLLTWVAWKRHLAEKAALDLAHGIFWQGDPGSGGEFVLQREVNMLAGPAWLLTGIFVSGPLSVFRAMRAWNLRLPEDPVFQKRVEHHLMDLRSRSKWLDAGQFRDDWDVIVALIQLGLVDYSERKQRLKAA